MNKMAQGNVGESDCNNFSPIFVSPSIINFRYVHELIIASLGGLREVYEYARRFYAY
jgi:hypothetical protein